MRFVPSSCLKPGMILGKDLYGYNNELMLGAGQKLTSMEIIRINLLKYQGVYIEDDLSHDIEIENIIGLKLKNKSIKVIKDVFKETEDGQVSSKNVAVLKNLVEDIVDEISINDNVIVNMIDLKIFDDYTYYHSVNVLILSVVIGVTIGLSKEDLYNLGLGAILHDIGKIYVPKDILNKNGKLTNDEFSVIMAHPENGSNHLREQWHISNESNLGVLTHHEKYDGTGYPYKLKEDKIPEFGRIIAIADVYDALTSDRPYRTAMLPSNAMEYIMGGSGTLFDPNIVKVFTKKVMPFPVGTCVTLSDGTSGIVVENYSNNCLRPKIKVMTDNQEDEVYYDLYNDRSLLNVTVTDIANF